MNGPVVLVTYPGNNRISEILLKSALKHQTIKFWAQDCIFLEPGSRLLAATRNCCFWNALYQHNGNGNETWTLGGPTLTCKYCCVFNGFLHIFSHRTSVFKTSRINIQHYEKLKVLLRYWIEIMWANEIWLIMGNCFIFTQCFKGINVLSRSVNTKNMVNKLICQIKWLYLSNVPSYRRFLTPL